MAVIAAAVAWLELCYSAQINASIATRIAAAEVRRQTDGGVKPQTLASHDHWGRPFLYLTSSDCDLLVSYGSDGKPDDRYDLSMCELPAEPRSSCAWPTSDTIYINGEPRKACGK